MKTADKILQTALWMFNENGYMQVGVREIARELNISPGNLSYHFPKKEDILFRLLEGFSASNSQLYEEYFKGEPYNARFLSLMDQIFHNQFRYRGVYIGNQAVQQELLTRGRFDYSAVAQKRKEMFAGIFRGLSDAGQLRLEPEDVEFLVSYMTLFGRFWIAEALLLNLQREEDEVVRHYANLLAKQLSLFATEEGEASVGRFLK